MRRAWVDILAGRVAVDGPAVRVVVIETLGSSPRDPGADMVFLSGRFAGSIGGGALEHAAQAKARELATAAGDGRLGAWHREVIGYPLGPDLGQCCGGHVTLLYEVIGLAEAASLRGHSPSAGSHAARPLVAGAPVVLLHAQVGDATALPDEVTAAIGPASPPPSMGEGGWSEPGTAGSARPRTGQAARRTTMLVRAESGPDWLVERLEGPAQRVFLYGAGHVGRALVRIVRDLPFALSWIDIARERFPADIPPGIETIVKTDPAEITRDAPSDAIHLVMTHSHPLDLAIVEAVLRRGEFAFLGLIGSATKRARFARRLAEDGLAAGLVDRIASPVGLPGIGGKEPAVIAVSIAADLLRRFP